MLLCSKIDIFKLTTYGTSARPWKAACSPNDICNVTLYRNKLTFLHFAKLFSSGRGSFLVLSAARHVGGRRVHTAQVWVPADVRDACSGRSS